MKKTLIAMAVAGVVSAPAFAGVGGSAALGYWGSDDYNDGTAKVGEAMVGGVLVLNASGEAQTNGGATVYGSMSLSASGQENGVGSTLATTGTVVGIKGGFGNISIGDGGSGAHMGQLAGDRYDVTDGGRYRHSFGYTNTFGPITMRATTDLSDTGVDTFGLQGVFGGVTVGVGTEDEDTVIGAAMSFGDVSLAIHSTSWDASNDDSLAIKVSYSAGDVSASYQTETMDDADTTKNQLDVSYNLGGGAAISLRNRDQDATGTSIYSNYTRILLSVGF